MGLGLGWTLDYIFLKTILILVMVFNLILRYIFYTEIKLCQIITRLLPLIYHSILIDGLFHTNPSRSPFQPTCSFAKTNEIP